MRRVKGLLQQAHEQGLWAVCGYLFRRYLFEKKSFLYIKETLPANISEQLSTLPKGFAFSLFGQPEIEIISNHPERKYYVGDRYVLDNYSRGDTCLGIKHEDEIVAFTWYSLTQSPEDVYRVPMGEKEAYLYDMYVFKKFRGHNLAALLRYKNYETLKGLGREWFYSITECANLASFRFKQKLGAQVVFKGIYLKLFGKFAKTWILKRS